MEPDRAEQLSVEDELAIERVIALYTHVVDGRLWDRLSEVFTADAVFDASSHGATPAVGVAKIRGRWERTPPQRHHFSVDTVARADGPGGAIVHTKSLSLLFDGSVSAGVYRDRFVRTDAGWRIAVREALTGDAAPTMEP